MGNNVMAYILMEVEIGRTDQVLDELRTIDQATRVSVTTGAYDIIILLEIESLEQLYDITVHRIHSIQGIKETTTAVIEKMEKI